MGKKKVIKGFNPEIDLEDGVPLPEHLNNEDGSLDNETWLRGKNNKQIKKDDKTTRTKRSSKTNTKRK